MNTPLAKQEPARLSLAGSPVPGMGIPDLPNADYVSATRAGLWILVVGFGGFFAWAALAPLDEGVPAPGIVAVESKRKRIDHLTGGIIEKILVREGDTVREGQELIVLNEVQVKAALNGVLAQWRVAAATEARLNAERSGLKAVRFPLELEKAAGDPDAAATMNAQRDLFRSRRTALEGELAIIRESVRGLELQIRSLNELKAGREKQIQLFNEQLASFVKLNAQGFVSRNQLLEIERQLVEVQSKQSEDLANIAAVNARLAEFRMRGAQREFEYRREVETQLTEIQRELSTLSERLAALRDTYGRLAVRAPVGGKVVDLAFHTINSTIKPGDRILDIVPEGDELVIEAQVQPQYVDRIRAGLPAEVHFDAYVSRARRPIVRGTVKTVSADVLTDSRTGLPYYAMRVSVPGDQVKGLGGRPLQPGMQGTVMVMTGERSLLAYLARPFLRRFSESLSEQ